jgi:polyhydroxyalkanoate synthesis regulator phasin
MKTDREYFLVWYAENYPDAYKSSTKDNIFNVDDLAKAYNRGQKSCDTEELQDIIRDLRERLYYTKEWMQDKNETIEYLKSRIQELNKIIDNLKKEV